MTDRHAGYVVTLAADIREDDAEVVMTALRMVKGVVGVEPVVSEPAIHIARERADQEWRARLYTLLRTPAAGNMASNPGGSP